jgi:catechol 2,3-dioxygenase-like lactoylglutathione lyase family enzyme
MNSSKRPRLSLTSVTIASPDPRRLGAFYALLLGADDASIEDPHPGDPETAGWAQVKAPGITLNFEFEKHWRTPRWPAQPGGQTATQHLDIWVDNLDEAVAWARTCGAELAEEQPQEDVRVMFDPVGHPFCLFL